ncbi:hypothetical protein DID80_02840 [Candidatus Marinamargulisbacteria bacterium SCGC AAA071-K20]|nr:hypothetical protein DID80_02840 [Candidatus Marinamargulisbacteria bacterium SCGC AAA071-K20]
MIRFKIVASLTPTSEAGVDKTTADYSDLFRGQVGTLGTYPLLAAAKTGDLVKLNEDLDKLGKGDFSSELNKEDIVGANILSAISKRTVAYASAITPQSIIIKLLTLGANPIQLSGLSKLPLHSAKSPDVILLLQKVTLTAMKIKYAEIEATDDEKHVKDRKKSDLWGVTFGKFCESGDVDFVNSVLALGTNPVFGRQSYTPFHMTAKGFANIRAKRHAHPEQSITIMTALIEAAQKENEGFSTKQLDYYYTHPEGEVDDTITLGAFTESLLPGIKGVTGEQVSRFMMLLKD